MELVHAGQVSFDTVYTEDLDMIIMVSGYEGRCTYLAKKLKWNNEIRVALAFTEKQKEQSRPGNDKFFNQKEFTFIYTSGEESLDFTSILKLLPDPEKKEIKILVDYSCMTKLWYHSFFSSFLQKEQTNQLIRILFAYTPSEFTEPKKPGRLKAAGPIGKNSFNFLTDRPIALIIGLGYENGRAEFLQKTVNPSETVLFYTDSSNDKRYAEKIYINNFQLIDRLHKNRVITYPVRDLEKTYQLLASVCLELRMTHRVILAPVGPKPFALVSMVLAAQYPDIEIWRIKAGKSDTVYDRQASGEPLVYAVEYGQDND